MSKKANTNLNLRVEPDGWAKMLPNFVIITWCVGSISIIIAILTLPWVKSFLDLAFKLTLRPRLDLKMLEIDFYVMLVTFIISMSGVWIQSKRCRRRNDRRYGSFLVFGIISFLMMAGYLGYIWFGR
ncbi:MAG TPA: hypothetical protein VHY08_17410 [Bacillota bacterium]|nr:hypothetical protein [Bacillota bacterium]